MYIKSLMYQDKSTNWKLESVPFKPLTLLVGASGVGKTQILKALLNLKNISHGELFNGFKWEIEFLSNKGEDCKWCGEFESIVTSGTRFPFEPFPEPQWNYPNIYFENLFINDKHIIKRDAKEIIFNGQKTVQLPQEKSTIYLLNEESLIKDIFESFEKIVFNNSFNDSNQFPVFCQADDIELKLNRYDSIESIRNSKETIRNKFYLCCKKNYPIFNEIENLFIDIFPSVEKITVDAISSIFNSIIPSIAIKEKGVLDWIHQNQISSGMFRSLMHIAELYLCADDTVILIDEFENSLGINCINQVTRSILDSERNLQFIITSHHPYIINDVGFEHWKIVTRNGSVVKAIDAEKFGIGRSKHQAFTQLANLAAFSEGTAN